jgi:hypothetical protein
VFSHSFFGDIVLSGLHGWHPQILVAGWECYLLARALNLPGSLVSQLGLKRLFFAVLDFTLRG